MSSTVLARVGRHRQRYENEFRLVAGCVPYRLKPVDEDDKNGFYVKKKDNDMVDLIHRLEVLMISTPNRHDLVFPKGGWENDETMGQAACREALEEAGVRGILDETILGEWIFRSKSRQNSGSNEGSCKGYMFALEVKEELERWPEQSSHKRRWVSVVDALRLCRYPWMREALASCIGLLSKSLGLPCTKLSELSSYQETSGYFAVLERANDASEPSSYYAVRERAIDVQEPTSCYFVKPAIDAIC